jgi:hypothetical protein
MVDIIDFIEILRDEFWTQLIQIPNFGKMAAKNLRPRLDTVSRKIRLPLPEDRSCNQTPKQDRWVVYPYSYLTVNDPRYASEEECNQIEATLLATALEFHDLPKSISDKALAVMEIILHRKPQVESAVSFQMGKSLKLPMLAQSFTISTSQIGSAELPVEYIIPLNEGGSHCSQNIAWIQPSIERLTVRELLRSTGIPINTLSKVQVKSYATDKVTMPPHFSNRDYRWATWVDSIQFSTRTQCVKVELELLCQILEFREAPKISAKEQDVIEMHLGRTLLCHPRRCPITGDELSYHDFAEAVSNLAAGKSPYHVGHFIPLTRGGRHIAENVVWMTEAGNRIQGNDTFDEVVALIRRAAKFHIDRCIIR